MCKEIGTFCEPLKNIIENLDNISGAESSDVVSNIIKVHMKCISGNAQKS